MKKYISLFALVITVMFSAQQTANRFFYELTFKPKKDSARLDKVMTVLDITKDKSIYQDFTIPAQDSLLQAEMEAMQKAGVYRDISKSVKMPKFGHKITKKYPEMNVTLSEMISMKWLGYEDKTKMDWKIQPEKTKIGEYNAQKATTEFGGRQWTAWFSPDIPLQDGPYKFHGLPGLIVKVEDTGNNYSWTLKGNKKVENYQEKSFMERNPQYGMQTSTVVVDRAKFEKAYNNFKADPLGEMRPYMTPELMNRKMPGSEKTVGELVKDQEKMLNTYFNANNNPIELAAKK